MTVQAVATPAGWIMEGECIDRGFHRPCTDECSERLLPPSVLTDAIGKPCENCDGRGRYQTTHARYDLEGNVESARFRNPNVAFDLYEEIEDGPWRSCEDCGGTGLASVELTVEPSDINSAGEPIDPSEPRNDLPGWDDWNPDDGPFTITIRVIPDKVLPIREWWECRRNRAEMSGPHLCVPDGEMTRAGVKPRLILNESWKAIDIGPNPAQYVGKYLVTGVAVST